MGIGAGGRSVTLGPLFGSLSVDGVLEKWKRLLTCKTKTKKDRVREGTELNNLFFKSEWTINSGNYMKT